MIVVAVTEKRKITISKICGFLQKGRQFAIRGYMLLRSVKTAITTSCRWIVSRTEAIWFSWNTYHRCDDTVLERYVLASKGNIRALNRHFAGIKMLETAFGMISSEYCELSGNRAYAEMVEDVCLIAVLKLRIRQFDMYRRIHAEYGGYMNEMRNLTGASSLKHAEGIAKQWVDRIREMQMSRPDDGYSGKYDMLEFISLIQKWIGFFPISGITVSEFASKVKLFNAQMPKISNG